MQIKAIVVYENLKTGARHSLGYFAESKAEAKRIAREMRPVAAKILSIVLTERKEK